MTDNTQDFIEDFLAHKGTSKAEIAAYNKAYYLKNRQLKGRTKSGDDVRPPTRQTLPKRDPKVYKQLRARFGTLIRETRHIMVPMLEIINSPTYTPAQKARLRELERQLMPYQGKVIKLQQDIKRSGFQKEFDKYDRFMPKPGRSNSANPRGARR